MARFLVTGGCGFIGSHLVEALLARGSDVRVLDDLSTGKRENVPGGVEVVVGDVRDPDLADRTTRGVDGVFHLAAVASVQRSNEDWRGTHGVNLTGTINIFEGVRRAGVVPVLYASSAAVYGNPVASPTAESTEVRPLTAYGADKLGSELHGRVAALVHGIPTMGFRFFNVYGPRQDPSSPYSGVISLFTHRVRARQGIDIFGDGLQVRDFVFVKDVVQFLLAGMERVGREPEVYNVCTGRSTTVLDLARKVMEITGNEVEIRHQPARTGDIRISIGDPERAAAGLDLRAVTPLDEGLGATLSS